MPASRCFKLIQKVQPESIRWITDDHNKNK